MTNLPDIPQPTLLTCECCGVGMPHTWFYRSDMLGKTFCSPECLNDFNSVIYPKKTVRMCQAITMGITTGQLESTVFTTEEELRKYYPKNPIIWHDVEVES